MDITFLEKYFHNETKIASSALKKKLFKYKIKQKKCERCNLEKWLELPIPLELHHINGDHNDNTLENLEILCPNCHAMTSNYRASKQKRIVIKKPIEDIIEAIENSYNSRQALIKLGYQPKGSNYSRIYSIMGKYKICFRPMTEEEKAKEVENRLKGLKISWGKRKQKAKITRTKEEAWIASRKVPRPSKEELLKTVWTTPITQTAKSLGICDNTIRKWAKQYQIPVPPVGWWAKWKSGHKKECELIKIDLFKSFNIVQAGEI